MQQDIRTNLERVRERIARAAERAGRRAEDVLLVGVSKTVEVARIRAALAAGLMAIPPAVERAEDARGWFRSLRKLAERHGLPELSMGMSGDFEIAVEEGATMVRVGTAIFGPRPPRAPGLPEG